MAVLPTARAAAAVEELVEELDRWSVYAQETSQEAGIRQRELAERVARAVRLTALGNDIHARDTGAVTEPAAALAELEQLVLTVSARLSTQASELQRSIALLDNATERLAVALRYNAAELTAQRERCRAANDAVRRAERARAAAHEVVESVEGSVVRRVNRRAAAAAAESLALADQEKIRAIDVLEHIKDVLVRTSNRRTALEDASARAAALAEAARDELARVEEAVHGLGMAADYVSSARAAHHRASVALTRQHEAVKAMTHRSWAAEASLSSARLQLDRVEETGQQARRAGSDALGAFRAVLAQLGRGRGEA